MDQSSVTYGYQFKEIISSGLKRSARSLSTMFNSQIAVEDIVINTSEVQEIENDVSQTLLNRAYILLKTEVIGPVEGINYALLTKEEVITIQEKTIEEELTENEPIDFMIEFLKEVENVLAAATLTELADVLKINIYGDVPKIQALDASQVKNVIGRETSDFKSYTSACCTFSAPDLGISPKIIWVFNRNV